MDGRERTAASKQSSKEQALLESCVSRGRERDVSESGVLCQVYELYKETGNNVWLVREWARGSQALIFAHFTFVRATVKVEEDVHAKRQAPALMTDWS